MRKKVIVACGGAVATSTVAAAKVGELCRQEGLEVEIVQCRVSEIESHADGAVLIVATSKVSRDFGVPFVSGVPFISGVGADKARAAILEALKGGGEARA
ncbi:MAG: PTS galactitol transporter subunit IIB [Deltaproteobacteria bacterium]|jgi:PTS system galactitol-specific IIB component|nr:PTS galactitol transporter subunit IIB [Deltaproteobacteria bacterium]